METPDLASPDVPLLEDPLLKASQPAAQLEKEPQFETPHDDRAALRSSLFVASKRPKPPTWAGVLHAAQQTQLSPDIVARNYDRVRANAAQQQPDLDRLVNDNPALAQWLSHPDNAALGRDEIPALSRLDHSTGILSRATSDIGTATATGAADLASSAGLLGATYGLVSPAAAARFVADMQQRAQSLRADAPAYAKDYNAAVGAAAQNVDTALGALSAAPVAGLVTAGNIDLTKRPRVANPDGSISTVRSMSFERDGKEILVPTVSDDGKLLTNDEAIAQYDRTGKHLGVFANADAATTYAQQLHEAQAAMLAGHGDGTPASQQSRTSKILTALGRLVAPSGIAGVPNADVSYTIGEVLDLIRAAGSRPKGLAYTGMESLASMAPMLAGAAAGTAAGGAIGSVVPVLGTAAGATIGGVTGTFAGMAPVSVGGEILAELTKRGVDVTNGDALERAFSDPAVMSAIRSKAERAGITNALVTSLVSGYAGKLGELAKESNIGVRAAARAADVSVQAAGMGAGQAAGQAAKDEPVSVGQAIESAISTLGVSAGMEAIGESRRAALHPETHEAAVDATMRADDALQAHHDAAVLEDIGKAVREAPITAKVPDRLRELVETAAGGADASTVYFQSEDWNRYWTGKGESPAQKAAEILGDDGKEYTEAQATGAPIAIPLADYVSRVAPTDDFQGLLPSARMRPDGASLEEAQSYLRDLPATLRELATEAGSSGQPTSQPTERGAGGAPAGTSDRAAKAAQIGADIERQLADVGVKRPEARANAALWESAFRTLGERANMDPLELYSRYGVRVQRGAALQDGKASAEQVIPRATGELAHSEDGGDRVRGRIIFGDKETTIELTRLATRATFMHETGHFWLRVLDDLGAGENAAPGLAADRRAIRDWLGAGEGEFTRGQHEQFARGVEQYLFEGKAPSEALRPVFSRFKRWLVGVYRDLRALNVPMTDDVRGVFDRLLASHDELEAAQRAGNVDPLFGDPKSVGLSDEQAARYREAVDAARQAAEEETTARVMREMRREDSREWKALREPIAADVAKEVDAEPIYRARALIDDGIPADIAAEMLGFDSGRELLDAMKSAPTRADAIRARTDERMQQEHGERLTDEQLRDQASLAVRNDKRAQLLRKELEILASDHLATMKGLVRAVGRVVPSSEAVRAQAENIIGGKAVQDVKPHQYELAARKAARDAREALLRGDVQGAFDAKRRELLNTALLRAASDARDTVEGALTEFRKVFRHDARLADTRDMDLVNAARAILASFGIGRSDKPASAYLEQLRKYDPDTYETIREVVDEATANARGYKQLSIDEFHALHETVSGLWEMSRRSREVEIDGKKVDRQEVVAALGERLGKLAPAGPRPGEAAAVTRAEKRVSGLMSMWAALRRVEHWVRQMDGGADDGPFRRYLWNPVNEGAVKFRIEKNRRMQQYRDIVDRLGPTMTHEKIPAPELGYTFDGKRELLGALLHSGNESNLRKLLAGRGWGAIDENSVLDSSRWRALIGRMQADGTLVKADYDFAQAVWDLFEETKPDAQRAHRDMYGRYFEEITAQPFTTPYGEYKGGYYPAKADPFMTPEQGRRESATAVIESDNSNMFPSTGRGFTKSRVEYNRPLIIDANAIPTHLDAVLRFTHINPHVVDVARVVRDRTFAGAMDAADTHAISELLDPWLRRSAQQAIDTPARSKAGRAVDDMARRLRRNAGMQILSGSLTTAAEQLTHVPAVALRVTPAALARGLWNFVRAPKQTAAEIHAKSDYMATRETAGLMEVRKAIDHIMLDPNTAQRAGAWMNEHAAFLTRAIQHVEDHVTWGGAYEEAVRNGLEELAAVRHADAVVRETLGAFEPESISRFEASTPVVKLFSMFYSFFNTKANFLKTEVTDVLQSDVGLSPKVAKLAAVYTFGFLLPAVMATAIKQQLNGQAFDKDDDGPWNDVLSLFFGSQIEQGARMVPVAGPLVQFSVQHLMGGKPADLVSSPALGLIQQAAQVPADVLHAVRDSEIKRGEITDLFTLLGLVSGTPVRPLAKPLGYLHDVNSGKAQPSGPVDFARGLVTGR